MPLEKVGNGWRWGKQGKVYRGKDAKKKALKQGYAEDPDHFKQEMGDARNHYDVETLTIAHRITLSSASIVKGDNGYKILGQGQEFATFEEALDFQYGG